MSNGQAGAHLERSIGLIGATSLVVGAVIGAGIFVLIGSITDQTGGAIWLAFGIAILVSVASAIPLVQIASALPRAGAGYFFASRLTTPLFGTITSMWILLGGACSTCVVALAFSEYVLAFVNPGASVHWVYGCAMLIVALFYFVYQFGVRLAMGLQVIFAVQMVIAFSAYCVLGLFRVELELAWLPPQGIGSGFLLAIVLCFNTCIGFGILAEMAEEVKDATRTIPLALFIGGSLVGILYVLIGLIYLGSLSLTDGDTSNLEAPLAFSASLFMPGWLVTFLGIGAITAGLTSLNAGAVALPRELFAQARDGILPAWLGKVDARTHSPLHAVTCYIIVVLLLLAIGWVRGLVIDDFSYVTVVGIQVATSAICVSALFLRVRFPEEVSKAYVQLPQWFIVLCTLVTCIASAGLILLLSIESPPVIIIFAILTVATILYQRIRVGRLRAAGVDFDARVRAIPESGIGAESTSD